MAHRNDGADRWRLEAVDPPHEGFRGPPTTCNLSKGQEPETTTPAERWPATHFDEDISGAGPPADGHRIPLVHLRLGPWVWQRRSLRATTPSGAGPDLPTTLAKVLCASPARARAPRYDPTRRARGRGGDRRSGSRPLRAACRRLRTAPRSRPAPGPRRVRRAVAPEYHRKGHERRQPSAALHPKDNRRASAIAP